MASDITSGLPQKTCAEDASDAFLLSMCSASHANFITIEPGKSDMAGHHLLWVWPHTRQCLLMAWRCNAVFRENAAPWPRTVLLGPALSDAKLAGISNGRLESRFSVPDSLFLVNLTNLQLVSLAAKAFLPVHSSLMQLHSSLRPRSCFITSCSFNHKPKSWDTELVLFRAGQAFSGEQECP